MTKMTVTHFSRFVQHDGMSCDVEHDGHGGGNRNADRETARDVFELPRPRPPMRMQVLAQLLAVET